MNIPEETPFKFSDIKDKIICIDEKDFADADFLVKTLLELFQTEKSLFLTDKTAEYIENSQIGGPQTTVARMLDAFLAEDYDLRDFHVFIDNYQLFSALTRKKLEKTGKTLVFVLKNNIHDEFYREKYMADHVLTVKTLDSGVCDEYSGEIVHCDVDAGREKKIRYKISAFHTEFMHWK